MAMAQINQTGRVLGVSWRSGLAIVQSKDGFCAVSSDSLIAGKNEKKVRNCAALCSGDSVHFDAETCQPFLTSIGNHVDIQVTHRATKAWLPSIQSGANARKMAKITNMKPEQESALASGNNGELGQEHVAPISKKMIKKACAFMLRVIDSYGGILTFEDLSMRFTSFPPDVQRVIGSNVPAFKDFIKRNSTTFTLTKSGNGVTFTPYESTETSWSQLQKDDQEACDYVFWFVSKAGGSISIHDLIRDVRSFPGHIRIKTGKRFESVWNFVKQHPKYLLLTGSTVTVKESAKSEVFKRMKAQQELLGVSDDHQVPRLQEVIMWSWGKGTVIAVGSTFGYLQGFSEQDDLVVLFDSDAALFEDDTAESDLSTRIQTGDAVRYVAYACPKTIYDGCTWKALVVWKSTASIENCLFNACVRVVQGKVTRVFQGGGSVTLGRSSDIRIPFSTSVIMCRSPVQEANKMVSVGDPVACVLREASIEHLPCLVIECVWKTELFDEGARDAPLKGPSVTAIPVTANRATANDVYANQLYGSAKVLCVTPTGGLLQHGDSTIAFESGVLYINGKKASTSKLSKGTSVFYYALASKDHEVTLKATLVWKGKKPKRPVAKDGPTLSTVCSSSALPASSDQEKVNFLLRDADKKTPVEVPGSTSLDVDSKGGILIQLDDSGSSLNAVEYLHLQNCQESGVQVRTNPALEDDRSIVVKEADLREARHVNTQTISTGDIITLRLHTS